MEIRDEFDKRKSEVEIYFDILQTIELDKPKLTSFDILENRQQEIIFDSQRINIFRASAFLLLYNLVESTVFNSVISIFDAINSERHNPKLKFNDVIDEVKLYWIDNIYKHDETIQKITVVRKFKELADKIFNESLLLASNYIKYGGSLDALKIKETAEALGLRVEYLTNGYRKDTHGEALKDVKQKRNWLAHGEKSFAEIGQDYTYQRLDEWRNYIIEHLEKYIVSIEDYISTEKYKISGVAVGSDN